MNPIKRVAAITAAATLGASGAVCSTMAYAAAPSGFVDFTTTDRAGVVLMQPDDSVKLKGTSEGFTAFMHEQMTELTAHATPGCPTSMNVTGASNSFAAGGVSDCGGELQLWSVGGDGSWHPLWGGQNLTPCTTLRSVNFSPEVYRTTGTTQCAEGQGRSVEYTG